MRNYRQGIFRPKNPEKYLGNVKNIVYRSSYELMYMKYLDIHEGVVGWSSEELVIHYVSPVDSQFHRYFPDFKVQTKTNTFIIEIKPHSQSLPPKVQKKKTKKYLTEVMTYGVNQAKWNAAEEYCKKRGWIFRVVTEKDLFGAK